MSSFGEYGMTTNKKGHQMVTFYTIYNLVKKAGSPTFLLLKNRVRLSTARVNGFATTSKSEILK